MPEPEKGGRNVKKQIFRPNTFSRRQVLRRLGVTVGSGIMTTLALMAACKNAGQTTTTIPGTATSAATTKPTTSPVATSVPTTPAATTPTTPATTPPASTAPATTGFNYLPPTTPPPLVDVPDSTCKVATDRSYSIEHIWVKTVEPGVVILGITTTMVEILGEPFKMTFPEVGKSVEKNDGFSEIEGYKVAADLISPVSGKVIQANTFLGTFSETHVMEPLINDPYNTGWMIAIKLSKPQEVSELLTWQSYIQRLGKA